jgi:hypothetical protein
MASTALAPVEPGGYLALNHTPKEIGAIIADNLGGEQLTEFDLARVKVPSGGGTTWEVPTLGGLEPTKALTGVLVHFKRTRAYWAPDADSGTPPQCRSEGPDLTAVGTGDPGGPCITCPNAEFGTAVDDSGRPAPGQACNSKEIWFLLQGGRLPPDRARPPGHVIEGGGRVPQAHIGWCRHPLLERRHEHQPDGDEEREGRQLRRHHPDRRRCPRRRGGGACEGVRRRAQAPVRRCRGRSHHGRGLTAMCDHERMIVALYDEFGGWVSAHPNAGLFDWELATQNVMRTPQWRRGGGRR